MLRASFLISNGALAIAVAAFRNSLVFHRLDYTVSLAIHAMPMLTTVQIRWWSMKYEAGLPEEQRKFAQIRTDITSEEYWDMMVWTPYKLYFIWMSVYALINFVICKRKIKTQNYLTLYTMMKEWKSFGVLIKMFGKRFSPLIFIVTHFLFFSIMHLFAIVCFHYEYVNKVYVIIVLLVAFKNGADFYMDYFARKYEQSIQALPKTA
jgi:hypothetical protein